MLQTLLQIALTLTLACATFGIFLLWFGTPDAALGSTILLAVCALIGVLCEDASPNDGDK